MQFTTERYGMGGQVAMGYAEAVEKTKEALKAEGFGVLCEIDVQATLKAKIGEDTALAHQALSAEPDLGLLLPCNVVVYQREGAVWIKAIEPHKMLSVVGNPDVDAVAGQVREKLERVLENIGT